MSIFSKKDLLALFASTMLCTRALAQMEQPEPVSQDSLCRREAARYEAQLDLAPQPYEPTDYYMTPAPDKQGRPFKKSFNSQWARLAPAGDDTLAEYMSPVIFNTDSTSQLITVQQLYGTHTANGPVKTIMTADRTPTPWQMMREFVGNETIYKYVRLNGPADQNNNIRLIVGKGYCLIAD